MSFASYLIRLSNYNYKNSRAKSLAASRPRRLSNYDSNKCQFLTSVDSWIFFYRSQISCSGHHLQQLIQVDWCIAFWGSKISYIYFSRRFLHNWIESWGSMCSSNLFSNLQVDCYLFQSILSLPQRLKYILWGRMGATATTWQTLRPCWPQSYWSPRPCKIRLQWPCWSN